MMRGLPAPPDVESAIEVLHQKICTTDIEISELVQLVADDWEVKEHILRYRFHKHYRKMPEELRKLQPSSIRIVTRQHLGLDRVPPVAPREVPGLNARQRPRQSDFGLPSDFSIEKYEKSLFLLEFSIFKWSSFLAIISTLLIFILGNAQIQNGGLYIEIFISLIIFMYALVRFLISKGRGSNSQILKNQTLVSKYRDALSNWRLTQTESGAVYWQNLKGIAFEQAIKCLMERRGCKASLTPATRDGGVDIVVSGIDSTYWCQCKGHLKRIAVGDVRQIKGVCSNSVAVPVLISSNGFTNPAIEEAKRLGVILIDSEILCRLANQDHITSLRHI